MTLPDLQNDDELPDEVLDNLPADEIAEDEQVAEPTEPTEPTEEDQPEEVDQEEEEVIPEWQNPLQQLNQRVSALEVNSQSTKETSPKQAQPEPTKPTRKQRMAARASYFQQRRQHRLNSRKSSD